MLAPDNYNSTRDHTPSEFGRNFTRNEQQKNRVTT